MELARRLGCRVAWAQSGVNRPMNFKGKEQIDGE
jgi:hypothetical protein